MQVGHQLQAATEHFLLMAPADAYTSGLHQLIDCQSHVQTPTLCCHVVF
jgi:hypothetical protein